MSKIYLKIIIVFLNNFNHSFSLQIYTFILGVCDRKENRHNFFYEYKIYLYKYIHKRDRQNFLYFLVILIDIILGVCA